MTKYGYSFPNKILETNTRRLINQIWKLVPMREKEENWQEHLKTVIEEISGLGEIYKHKLNFLILLSKLEGLTDKVCEDFMLYRKTVFRCIDLVAKVFDYE